MPVPASPLLRVVPAILGLLGLTLAHHASAEDALQATSEYAAQKAELEAMLSTRDLDLYEFNCEPVTLDRIVVKDRMGVTKSIHYLVFRLRNQIASNGTTLISQAKGYQQVLATVAKEYDQAKISSEHGSGLRIEGVEGKDAVIIERQDAHSATRKIDISVQATNEYGTRLRLLDEIPGSGPQETFNFPDLGQPSQNSVSDYVRDRVEEAMGRKLLTTDEIRSRQLPPYDPTARSEEGWAVGEVFGVVLFANLPEVGRKLTFEFRGLSNKFRIRWPETEKGKVENYLNTRFYRRTYIVHYDRPGDEYFRDQDTFKLERAGWEWLATFQRNDKRRAIAYSRYVLNNVVNDTGEGINKDIEAEFWASYEAARAAKPDRLPDFQKKP